ncbi:hypothetical protein MP638_007304 [Amoeboaphelidium occidentale]|nr:hypothetical protein MP638_007304 [Amoeboaphelidium occidentale]
MVEKLDDTSQSTRPLIVGPDEPLSPFPVYLRGEVVKGFGRGSKELGIPTANFHESIADNLSEEIGTGIYFGWASISGFSPNGVYPMVMSVGWNPFYKNERKSAEVHVIHDFGRDFYGATLKVIVMGFVRNEQNYSSLDALIADIKMDIKVAVASLERPEYHKYKQDAFL